MCTEDYKWHYDYVRLAWDAGFSFDKCKHPNFDKNKICLVDIERIIKDRDVASVERFLPMVIQFALENDQAELLDTNFVKMFRLSQLSVEYLLFCKKYLDNTVVLLKKENKELKAYTEELEGHISTLSKQNLITTFKCNKCPKVFSSEEYLNSHLKRRHNGERESKTSANIETDQLQSEIKQLKERLNNTEKLLQEKDEKAENVKLEVNEYESKLKVNEVLEKFERFKDKVENDLKILQIEKKFYEEKYSKLFDIVLESSRKESVNSEVIHTKELYKEKHPVEGVTPKIETTTQTEKESLPTKELQIEIVHDKNIFEFKETTSEVADIQDTIEQKITQFEEQIETKISTGLTNIEKQMQAFWGKLSELESRRETTHSFIEGQSNIQQQEIVQTEVAKPKIKPRMKLSKPSNFVHHNQENAKKIKAEIEKMCIKADVSEEVEKIVSENNEVNIPSVMYDSSSSSESEAKSVTEKESDSEISRVEVLAKKGYEKKESVSALGKRQKTSLKKAAQTKQEIETCRKEMIEDLNTRLQDIGISPNWTGIPQKTFEKALEIIQHQANRLKRAYPDFESIRKSIEISLQQKVEAMQKEKTKKSNSINNPVNIINIRYKKKTKDLQPEPETKPSTVLIKNRSFYNTDSDTEDLLIHKPPTKVSEAVPTYSAVIRELKESQKKEADTDSDINSIILPKETVIGEVHTKSAMKNYPSVGSLTKKKVLFDIESNEIEVEAEVKGSLTSIDSSDVIKVDEEEKKQKKNDSSLSDFDLS